MSLFAPTDPDAAILKAIMQRHATEIQAALSAILDHEDEDAIDLDDTFRTMRDEADEAHVRHEVLAHAASKSPPGSRPCRNSPRTNP